MPKYVSRTITASTAAIVSALLLSACASGGKPVETAQRGPAAGLDQSERLLSHARAIQAEKGCAEAVPTYRVIASFGEGYEVAQYELGACLIETAAAATVEATLFTEEGLLWLRRAAWAGNARAQWRLATILSGAPSAPADGVGAAPIEAMGWALVYENNATRALYGLAPVNPNIIAHLDESMPEGAKHDAAKFADDFAEVKMAVFTPPARPQNARRAGGGKRGSSGDGGQQRRRRQAEQTAGL